MCHPSPYKEGRDSGHGGCCYTLEKIKSTAPNMSSSHTQQQQQQTAPPPPPPPPPPPASSRMEESDYDSSCSSSVTAPSSRRSWISDVSSSSISLRSSSSSSSYFCHCESNSAVSVGSSSRRLTKPHKANQAEWEAIERLRSATGGCVGLHHFRLLRRLGSGDIGNVYLCRLREEGVGVGAGVGGLAYAMKVVDVEALAVRNKAQRAETEREILGLLDHPFLPTLYASFGASHYSCLLMEFCPGGDLYAVRQRQPGRRFSVASAKFYVAEVLLALEYLHMMGVVYRDLKPENVLLRADGHIMLSDFDLSFRCNGGRDAVVPKLILRSSHHHRPPPPLAATNKNINYINHSSNNNNKKHATTATSCVPPPMQPVLSCFFKNKKKTKTVIAGEEDDDDDDDDDDDEEEEEEGEFQPPELVAEPVTARSKSFVGTHEYLAPEVISGVGHGSAVDWWALGVFLYELLFGRTPFKGEDNGKTLVNILQKPLSFPRMAANGSDWEDMVRAQDLISRLLVKNPKRRIGSLMGSAEIKRHEFFKGVNWALIRSVRPPDVPCCNLQRVIRSKAVAAAAAAPTNTVQKLMSRKERRRDNSTEAYQVPPDHQHFDYF